MTLPEHLIESSVSSHGHGDTSGVALLRHCSSISSPISGPRVPIRSRHALCSLNTVQTTLTFVTSRSIASLSDVYTRVPVSRIHVRDMYAMHVALMFTRAYMYCVPVLRTCTRDKSIEINRTCTQYLYARVNIVLVYKQVNNVL